jgi:uncharacterized membrane protein
MRRLFCGPSRLPGANRSQFGIHVRTKPNVAFEILFFQRDFAMGAAMQEKRIHQIFVASVLFKGVHALIEIVGGVALYLISTEWIVHTINRFSRDQQIDDPDDWVANHLLEFARTFSVEQHHFYAFYLLSHGIIKSILIVGLLREKLWAYPASFGVFGAFNAYQLYRYSFTHDFALILLSIFDLFVIYLAVHEYRLLRKHLPTH